MTLTALLRWNNTAEPISLTVQMNYNDINELYMSYNDGWWFIELDSCVYLAWAEAEQKHDSPKSTAQFSLQTDIVYLEWATAGKMIVFTASPSLRCSVSLPCVVPPWLYYDILLFNRCWCPQRNWSWQGKMRPLSMMNWQNLRVFRMTQSKNQLCWWILGADKPI